MAETVLFVVVFLIFLTCLRIASDIRAIRRHKYGCTSGKNPSQPASPVENPADNDNGNDNRFRCKVDVTTDSTAAGETVKAFAVHIRGCIIAPSDMHDTYTQVLLSDVTDALAQPQPVLCSRRQWQMEQTPAFRLTRHNGRMPKAVSILSEWTHVATIRADILKFPSSGNRKLRFVTSVISVSDGSELASSDSVIEYLNGKVGYADDRQNAAEAQDMAVQLAKALCAQDSVTDVESLCQQLTGICSTAERYRIMISCLKTLADAEPTKQQTALLCRTADMLELDKDRFRAMAIKTLPLNIDENGDGDMELLLGITASMDSHSICRQLNEEYRKWNARVTHPNGAVRNQADKMLNLIACARNNLTQQTA